jgi:hypothetical protein
MSFRRMALAVLASLLVFAGVARADDWKDFSSPDGRFTVEFPGTPKQVKDPRQTKFGKVEAQLVILSVSNKVFYGVEYLDYPASVLRAHGADELLDDASDSAVKGVKGARIESKETINVNGNPGRQLVLSAPGNLQLTMRMYLVKNRLYQVIASVGQGEEKTADPKRFLDSFKLTG